MYFYLSQTPKYLKKSELYQDFYSEYGDDGFVEVGIYVPPETEDVNTFSDFILLFHTYNIWTISIENYGNSFTKFIKSYKKDVIRYLFSIEDQYDQAKILIDYILGDNFLFRIEIIKKGTILELPNQPAEFFDSFIVRFTIEQNKFTFTDVISVSENVNIFVDKLIDILENNGHYPLDRNIFRERYFSAFLSRDSTRFHFRSFTFYNISNDAIDFILTDKRRQIMLDKLLKFRESL